MSGTVFESNYEPDKKAISDEQPSNQNLINQKKVEDDQKFNFANINMTVVSNVEDPSIPKDKPIISSNDRTITGFLVSFSFLPQGEYWILREGKNLIGNDQQNTINLKEQCVSKLHAIILVRRSKNDDRLMYVISDQNSTNGILINGKDIELQSYELKNNDIIKIGGYELFFIQIDKINLNLGINKDFKPIMDMY
jgi:hypothetical protein